MAAHVAALAGEEIDADVGEVGGLAQVVFAHEAVEVHGRAFADGGDDVDDFGDGLEVGFDFADGGIGGLEGGAFGHVDDDLQFVLVVEGQHFEGDAAGGGEEDGEAEEGGDGEQEEAAAGAGGDEGGHETAVEAVGAGGGDVVGGDVGALFLEELAGDPGGDGEGDEEGAEHGERDIEGHGSHVGAHHAGDEEHRDEGDDDGKRGEQDRRHDLLHGQGDGLEAWEFLHGEEAGDVFHADDGVVHEQAEGEDEGEEGDTVDGIAEEVIEEEGDGIGDGDGEADDEAFAPAHGEGDEADNGQQAHGEVHDEVVDLFVGGLAVVAGDGGGNAFGQEGGAQVVEHVVDLPGDADGVAAFFLGDGDGDGVGGFAGFQAAGIRHGRGGGAGGEAGIGVQLVGAVHDLGDVAQIDGSVLVHADHQAADFVGVVEEGAGLDGDFAVGLGEGSARGLGVGHLEGAGNLHGGEAVGGEAFGVEINVDHALLAAVDGDFGAVGDALELVGDDLGDAVELVGAVLAAVESDVDDGDIVDFDGFDDPAGDAGGGLVDVLEDLVVDLDEAVLAVFADEEAHGDDGQARAGHGVDVFNAVDLVEHLLQAGRDELFDLGGGAAGHHDHDVGERHDDLGILLAGGDEEGGGADGEADEDQQDRQVALQEGLKDAGGDGVFAFFHGISPPAGRGSRG